jgi:hypothetical protein
MSQLSAIWRSLSETLVRGSGDTRVLILSFAIAAIAVSLLLIVVLVVIGSVRRSADGGAGLPDSHRRRRWELVLAPALSVLLLLALGTEYLGRSEMCARCHAEAHTSSETATHASVACIECHRQPGALGFVAGQVDYVRCVVGAMGGSSQQDQLRNVNVASRSCLRCHSAMESGVFTDGVINVRHVDFLQRPCTDCHNTVGHGEFVAIPRRPDMRVCLTCHDARQVSAECSMCHVGDVAYAARRAEPRPSAIKVAAPVGTNCRGCHDTTACNDCHGVEMPHPPDWMPGHARPAFVQPEVCWRCHAGPTQRDSGPHPYALCNRCHRFPGPHGSSASWRAKHGAAANKAPGIIGRTRCSLCHTNERFCDVCHEGRRERVDYR